jgi:hypothetical protein
MFDTCEDKYILCDSGKNLQSGTCTHKIRCGTYGTQSVLGAFRHKADFLLKFRETYFLSCIRSPA